MSPVPEPASALLRRLHGEATHQDCDCITPHAKKANAQGEAVSLLPALADLVEEAESEYAGHRQDCTCTMHPLLAALRERLAAKP